ncbi:MAG: hypothetical protein V1652_01290 [bacterium]
MIKKHFSELSQQVIDDLDLNEFISFFFLPFVSGSLRRFPELDTFYENHARLASEVVKYHSKKEFATLKHGEELTRRQDFVKKLMCNKSLEKSLENVVVKGYQLALALGVRENNLTAINEAETAQRILTEYTTANDEYWPFQWRRDCIDFSQSKVRESIAIELDVLQKFIAVVEAGMAIEENETSDIAAKFRETALHINETEKYAWCKAIITDLEEFGTAELTIRYNFFNKINNVVGVSYKSRNKSITKMVGWYYHRKDKKAHWLDTPQKEERILLKSLELLVGEQMSNIMSLLRRQHEFEFFLNSLRYIDTIRSYNLPIVFPIMYEKADDISFHELYNPCLLMQCSSRKLVSNMAQINDNKKVIIITGPNNSGKSVYIKSIGIAHILAQNGLPICAKKAKMKECDRIATHCIAKGDIAQGEGMFVQELNRIDRLIDYVTPNSLILIDEPIRGSSFEDAEAMTLRLIKGFAELGAVTYITTHLHDAAQKAEEINEVKNLRTEIVEKKFTYKVISGREKSYGLQVADEYGLTEEAILRRMKEKKESVHA